MSEYQAQHDALLDVINTATDNVIALMGEKYVDNVRECFDDAFHFAAASLSSGWVHDA